mgnify:CR=1 FL=1
MEFSWTSRIKYALMAMLFGMFGLHRFARGQIKSGLLLLVIFGASVFYIGNAHTLYITLAGIALTTLLAWVDALCMIINGRFYTDEKNVKIKDSLL